MKKIILLGSVLGFTPLFAFAAVNTTIGTIFSTIIGLMNYVVPALITVAVIYFVWGVITFISSSEDEAKKEGRQKIINGLIGLFVIVSFWGIIGIVKNTFGVGNMTGENVVPYVPTMRN